MMHIFKGKEQKKRAGTMRKRAREALANENGQEKQRDDIRTSTVMGDTAHGESDKRQRIPGNAPEPSVTAGQAKQPDTTAYTNEEQLGAPTWAPIAELSTYH